MRQEAVVATPALSARPSARVIAVNIGLAVLSGVLLSLAFPPFELWWVSWFALVPLFVLLRRPLLVRNAGRLALLFGMVLSACSLTWMSRIFGAGAIGIFLLIALPWYLFGMAYHTAARRLPPGWMLLLAPMFWLAADWVRCEGWYFSFSWLQVGQSQVVWGGGRALYPYIGVFGVTFLIVLVNAALARIFENRGSWRTRLLPAGVALAGIALTICILPHADYAPPAGANRIVARAVQGEEADANAYRDTSLQASAEKPALIIWPELAVPTRLSSYPATFDDIRQVARDTHAVLVLGTEMDAPKDAPVDWLRRRGMMQMEGRLFYNTALVLGPDGAELGRYYKTHPIQFFSDGVPGTSFTPVATPLGRLGLAICYDFDYASTAWRLVHNGAEILVVPTFDKVTWGPLQHAQHSRIAQARAAEVGRWTVRATSSGISQIITPRGELLAALPSTDSTNLTAAITGAICRETTLTPYVRIFFLLPYLCLVGSLCWVAWMLGKAASNHISRRSSKNNPFAIFFPDPGSKSDITAGPRLIGVMARNWR